MTIKTDAHDIVIKPFAADKAHVKDVPVTAPGGKEPDAFVFCVKPWGFEHACLRNKYFDIWELVLNPDASTSAHIHTKKDVLMIVLKGQIVLKTSKKMELLDAGEHRVIKRGALHQILNETSEHARILEIESPPNRNDLIRVKDHYGRVGLPYFHMPQEKRHALPSPLLKHIRREEHFRIFTLTHAQDNAIAPIGIHCTMTISPRTTHLHSLREEISTYKIRAVFVLQGSILIHKSEPRSLKRGDTTHVDSTEQLIAVTRNTMFIGW